MLGCLHQPYSITPTHNRHRYPPTPAYNCAATHRPRKRVCLLLTVAWPAPQLLQHLHVDDVSNIQQAQWPYKPFRNHHQKHDWHLT